MRGVWLRRAAGALGVIVAVAGLIWFAWPQPVGVDWATVNRGPIEITVDDEAKTRVQHIYTVSAPIAGRVLRISPPLHVGDEVIADETVVAVMQPAAPGFLDIRSRSELEAALAAAEAAVTLGEAEVRRLEASLEFARAELRRAEQLARTQAIAARSLDKARLDVDTTLAALASAKAQLEVRRHERHNAAARLIEPSNTTPETNPRCCIQLRAPITGRVLKINQESEAVVQSGAALLEVGDPKDLEVVAELLSSDAVQVQPGARVRIDGWGGPPVRGSVTRIDPAGFLKVSALGIEEQRVRSIIAFVDPPSSWSRLGHDYRVIVHITISRAEDALIVPVSAFFRKEDEWAVYAVRDGRVRTTPVKIGRRNNRMAEVLSGLSSGDRVVLHPSDRVKDGIRVVQRVTR
jgi:HlyD family secretion protein